MLDGSLAIIASETLHFDSQLPHYKTKDGVYRDPSENGRIVSPTLMWVEALDILLEKLKSKLDFSKVVAISGSGQQHGSVYWKKGSSAMLASLDPSKSLLSQLENAFSAKESPIWMDSSTSSQYRERERKLLEVHWSYQNLLDLVLMRDIQDLKFGSYMRRSKIFERISLFSSFMASLFIGGYDSIDETDAAGMNLIDIREHV